MPVTKLTRDQLIALKQHYLMEEKKRVSYGELANIDQIVPDETIFSHYAGFSFSPDDFN